MAAQLSGMKKPGGSDTMELRSLVARAANAERRLNNAQNQLVTTEEKIAAMNQKNAAADSKWEARVKEYEARLKAAEERVKRERQGSKERVAELENNLKCVFFHFSFLGMAYLMHGAFRGLQRQLELAQKRNNQLNDVIESNKASGSNSPAR